MSDHVACNIEPRERQMVTVERNEQGVSTVWCDPCIEPLIRALIEGGLRTVASCCGHGRHPGWVALADGRVLVVAASLDEAHWMEDLRRANPRA